MGNPLNRHNASTLDRDVRKLKPFTKTDETVVSYTCDDNVIGRGKKAGINRLTAVNESATMTLNYTYVYEYSTSSILCRCSGKT